MIRALLLVAIALLAVGCATEGPDVGCGDDIGLGGGLDIRFEGLDDAVAYDFAIDADGTSLVVSSGPDETNLSDEVELGAGVRVRAAFESSDSILVTRFEPPADPTLPNTGAYVSHSRTVPDQVDIVATSGGVEVGRARFTPVAGPRDYPWGMSCMYTESASAVLQLSAPP